MNEFGFDPSRSWGIEQEMRKKHQEWPGVGPFKAPEPPSRVAEDADRLLRDRLFEAKKEHERQPLAVSVSFSQEALDRFFLDDIPQEAKRLGLEQEAKQQQAQHHEMIDRFKRLPNLKFEPGMTLIVGDNGAGKSTLARALFYAMRYQSQRDEGCAAKEAHELVFEPQKGAAISRAEVADFKRAGLGPKIAQAMRVEQTGIANNRLIQYEDCTGISGMDEAWDYSEFEHGTRAEDVMEFWRPRRSNRQTVDASHEERRELVARKPDRKEVYFIDEPEVGMSPRRQKALKQEVATLVSDKSIQVVVTNSMALFDDPDIPRIDLDYPERGIFRPRNFPG